jgi:hypothetical protein
MVVQASRVVNNVGSGNKRYERTTADIKTNIKCEYEALEQPCRLCKERGFECGTAQKVRGPKTEQKQHSRGSNEFPGQFVFNFSNSPPVVRPEQPITTPIPQPAFSSIPVDTQINLNVFPFTLFEDSGVQTPVFDYRLPVDHLFDPWFSESVIYNNIGIVQMSFEDISTICARHQLRGSYNMHLDRGDNSSWEFYIFSLNGSYETGEVFPSFNVRSYMILLLNHQNFTRSKRMCGSTGASMIWHFAEFALSLLLAVLLLPRFQKAMVRTGRRTGA